MIKRLTVNKPVEEMEFAESKSANEQYSAPRPADRIRQQADNDEIIKDGNKGIVTSFGSYGNALHILWDDGIVNSYKKDSTYKKTGRNVADKLNELLMEIGGE